MSKSPRRPAEPPAVSRPSNSRKTPGNVASGKSAWCLSGLTSKVYSISPAPTVTIGGGSAQPVVFAGLIPPFSQLYQVNVTIPPGTPNGDQALVVTVNGTQSFPGLITI